jgi:hypothetical protein
MEQTLTKQQRKEARETERQLLLQQERDEAERRALQAQVEAERRARLERLAQEEAEEEAEEARQEAERQAQQADAEELSARLARFMQAPGETVDTVIPSYIRQDNVIKQGALTSKTQVGKTGVMIESIELCPNHTLVVMTCDNRKDQLLQQKRRLESNGINPIEVTGRITKIADEVMLSYTRNSKPVLILLHNGSKVNLLRKVLKELNKRIKNVGLAVLLDEGDMANKTDTAPELRTEAENKAVQKAFDALMFEAKKNRNYRYVKFVWVTATPENCHIIHNIKCEDTMVIKPKSEYRPVNKHIPIENTNQRDAHFLNEINRLRGTNQVILYCNEFLRENHFGDARKYARNYPCLSLVYNSDGIWMYDGEDEEKLIGYSITQALSYAARHRRDRTIVVFGFKLMTRGMSFIGDETHGDATTATVIFYEGGDQAHMVGIAQMFGRVTGNSRPDLNTRTVYCKQEVYDDYVVYLENQDKLNHAIALPENKDKTVREVMRTCGQKPIRRNTDRSGLKAFNTEIKDICNGPCTRGPTEPETDVEKAVKLIRAWKNILNTSVIAELFKRMVVDEKVPNRVVDTLYENPATVYAIAHPNTSNNWHLVFKTDGIDHFFTERAKEILVTENITKDNIRG